MTTKMTTTTRTMAIEIRLTMIYNFFPFISFVFATHIKTDGGTDTATYRNAETHLKRANDALRTNCPTTDRPSATLSDSV